MSIYFCKKIDRADLVLSYVLIFKLFYYPVVVFLNVRKNATGAILYQNAVFILYIFGISATILKKIKRTKAEKAIHMLRLVAGIIFAVSVFKIRVIHYLTATTTLRYGSSPTL